MGSGNGVAQVAPVSGASPGCRSGRVRAAAEFAPRLSTVLCPVSLPAPLPQRGLQRELAVVCCKWVHFLRLPGIPAACRLARPRDHGETGVPCVSGAIWRGVRRCQLRIAGLRPACPATRPVARPLPAHYEPARGHGASLHGPDRRLRRLSVRSGCALPADGNRLAPRLQLAAGQSREAVVSSTGPSTLDQSERLFRLNRRAGM